MAHGPWKTAEAVTAMLIPPACREEVLGDLHERYRSPLQYGFDVLRTVPLVILSRVRRSADPQALLLQAVAVYLSFLGAAWFTRGAVRADLFRLAMAPAVAMTGVMIQDAYARPGLARAPAMGLGSALLLQGFFEARIVLYGCAMGFLLCSALRVLFASRLWRIR
jgi:hypothetical protein